MRTKKTALSKPVPKREKSLNGQHLVICGNAFEFHSPALFPLIICDPPYGKITKEKWDVANYIAWMNLCVNHAALNATIAMWGGVGKPLDRPFINFACTVEHNFPGWSYEWITWSKRRAYGTPNAYLFTREELLILRRGNPTFNIPLLSEECGYEGYNKAYPAKSKFLRRTLVWKDITEIFRGKLHVNQKPDALYRVIIEAHSSPGDWVFDPCAGSGTTQRAAKLCGRNSLIIEQSQTYLSTAGLL